MDLSAARIEDFQDRVGEPFHVSVDPDRTLEWELVAATPGGPAPAENMRPPFSLTFLGPISPVFAQRLYHVEHDKMGGCDLFLVPIGPNEDNTGMQYEAVFG